IFVKGALANIVKLGSPGRKRRHISNNIRTLVVPEIKAILRGYVFEAFLTPWTLLIKALGLALAVASGLSLGKKRLCFFASSRISTSDELHQLQLEFLVAFACES
ncbi:hypothetical protein MPER_05586, partial [Moniliophthora perniciosa FA553]